MTEEQKNPARALQALDDSISHWEAIARLEPGHEPTGDQCALCDLHYNDLLSRQEGEEESSCKTCPVYQKTKKPECIGSPWKEAFLAWGRLSSLLLKKEKGDPFLKKDIRTAKKELSILAQEEVDFLKSLRPEVERNLSTSKESG